MIHVLNLSNDILRTLKLLSFIQIFAKESHFHFRWNSSHLTYCTSTFPRFFPWLRLKRLVFLHFVKLCALKNVGDTFLPISYCCAFGGCEEKSLSHSGKTFLHFFFEIAFPGGHYDIWKDKTTNSHFTRFCNVFTNVFEQQHIKYKKYKKIRISRTFSVLR